MHEPILETDRCPSEHTLAAFVVGDLSRAHLQRIIAHLDARATC